MKKQTIHPTAIIESGANIGDNVTIEPYVIIKSSVNIEDDVTIKAHAYIDGNTSIGQGTIIYPFACIGSRSQDLKYRGEKTFVKIGKNCTIREYSTINSSCGEGSVVEVGDECVIMSYCHIAHNCSIGNRVIMSNNATLAGHVIIEDCAIIGGLTPIHQFCRIGAYSMVGGLSRINQDVPPYTIGGGIPYKFGGINRVGLKRHGFSLETRVELSKAYKMTFRLKLSLEEALKRIERDLKPLPEIKHWIKFCTHSQRGLISLHTCSKEQSQQSNQNETLKPELSSC